MQSKKSEKKNKLLQSKLKLGSLHTLVIYGGIFLGSHSSSGAASTALNFRCHFRSISISGTLKCSTISFKMSLTEWTTYQKTSRTIRLIVTLEFTSEQSFTYIPEMVRTIFSMFSSTFLASSMSHCFSTTYGWSEYSLKS